MVRRPEPPDGLMAEAAALAGAEASDAGKPNEPPHPRAPFKSGCMRAAWMRGWLVAAQLRIEAVHGPAAAP